MIRSRAFGRIAGLLTSLALVLAVATPAAAVDGDRYVALANQKRASVGLPPVSLASAVDKVSDERAVHMAKYDDFSHDMNYVAQRLKALGVCFTAHGEIIAWERGYPSYDPARTMESWWKSQGHHDIIVGNYNAAGGSHRTSTASNKIYSVMIFVRLCSSASGGSTDIQRLAGSDRYATAAAISKSRFGGGASTVFIATGASFPDALAGSPAAARLNGPILLTDRWTLPGATATELDRLNPSKIVILGGTGAVSDTVAARLKNYAGSVVRWAGADRFATAAKVSQQTFASGVPVAYVATGMTFPDALSGGAIAGRNGGPILLVKKDSVPTATAAELDRLNPGKIVILGGTGAVNSAVAEKLKTWSGSVSRLSGADRYATAVQVSRAGYGSSGSDAVFVATGANFPDGLAGGPVAALVPGPLLLVASTSLPSAVASELSRLGPDKVYVLGGTSSVSDGVVRSIDATLP
ncbi:MAG: cell wall-binding repeat-containing protein [Chloroflexi bacterium]|nr:cell wall-binding repeat-containing protein [Chloroflexota bacterium]